jgi:hypothetical protein
MPGTMAIQMTTMLPSKEKPKRRLTVPTIKLSR